MPEIIDIEKLRQLVDEDLAQMYRKVIKLGEESGETMAAFLDWDKSPNVSASSRSDNPREALMEEAVDTMLCAMDVIVSLGYTNTEIRQMADRKMDKWQNKIKNRKSVNKS